MLRMLLSDNIVRLLLLLSNFTYNIYLVRTISADEFGISVLVLFFSNFYILSQLGIEYYYFSNNNNKIKVLSNYLLIKIICLVIVDILILLYLYLFQINWHYLLPYVIILIITQSFMEYYSFNNLVLIDKMNYKIINLNKILSSCTSILISYIFIINGYLLEGILSLRYVEQFVTTILNIIFNYKEHKFIKYNFDLSEIRNILIYGWKNILANLISKVYGILDIYWLSINFTYSIMGYYSKGIQLIGYIQMFFFSSLISYLPKFLSFERFSILYISNIAKHIYVIISSIYLIALVLSKNFILVFYGDNWIESYNIIVLVIPFYIILTVENILIEIVKCKSEIIKFIKYKCIILLIIIPFLFGIRPFGIMQLTIFLTISSFLSVCLTLKLLNIKISDFIKIYSFYFLPIYFLIYFNNMYNNSINDNIFFISTCLIFISIIIFKNYNKCLVIYNEAHDKN